MSGQNTTTDDMDRKTGGCENIVSFVDFAARMAKRNSAFAHTIPCSMAAAGGGRVIYIGDLR